MVVNPIAAGRQQRTDVFAVLGDRNGAGDVSRLAALNTSNFNVALPQHAKVYQAVQRRQAMGSGSRNTFRRRAGKPTRS